MRLLTATVILVLSLSACAGARPAATATSGKPWYCASAQMNHDSCVGSCAHAEAIPDPNACPQQCTPGSDGSPPACTKAQACELSQHHVRHVERLACESRCQAVPGECR